MRLKVWKVNKISRNGRDFHSASFSISVLMIMFKVVFHNLAGKAMADKIGPLHLKWQGSIWSSLLTEVTFSWSMQKQPLCRSRNKKNTFEGVYFSYIFRLEACRFTIRHSSQVFFVEFLLASKYSVWFMGY